MNGQSRGWVDILQANDAEAQWEKLFRLVSKHSSIRKLYEPNSRSSDTLLDFHKDLAQDLYLRLYQKDRWQHYLDAAYTDADIEHELYHIEIPNLVSLHLRERHPEAYRIVRRISNLIKSRPEFRRFDHLTAGARPGHNGKLTLKVYGLKEWSNDKLAKPSQSMPELIKEVRFRGRDRRRAGRGSSSHIIISNNDLTELIVEVFRAIDSPAEVRVLRALALSKLPVEDSRFISMDTYPAGDGASDAEPLKVDFTDRAPSPEELLLQNETARQFDRMVTELFDRMREAVRNKPHRYRTLVRVAWHCYFDAASPSQSSIARSMGISNSLVSNYRKLFDTIVRDVDLSANQYVIFVNALSSKLKVSFGEMLSGLHERGNPGDVAGVSPAECSAAPKSFSAIASRVR